ncbi:predicted protein [Histoplasma capsulatum H143]|uniref:Uncharacterized protein n=1 Tax=Ajellomyces capsulatus (strain H143) TaxID=544712 RepID=C6HGP6_AJECH|nr:predicted protein [Histoplasma capsulatum H143]
MAKGLRSSVMKRIRRSYVPKCCPDCDRGFRQNSKNKLDMNKTEESGAGKEMDIDVQPGATKPSAENMGRIRKRVRRKTRPSITFAARPQKTMAYLKGIDLVWIWRTRTY